MNGYGGVVRGRWKAPRTDAVLVRAAQAGDDLASLVLLRKYRALVRCKARSYFIAGGDRDDVIQEGMVGLFKAIRDYDPGRDSSFRSFADLCVTRQMITAIKTATRQKHAPLNGYVSLHGTVGTRCQGERLFEDILAAREVCDPAEIVISAWEAEFIRTGFIGSLSPFESDVLRSYMDGASYCEIARRLGRSVKAVDNALQRVKRKMETQLIRCRAC
ncbi:MAG: RNA polymerase sporulation sigma factor SigH [Clostridiales bacterium]|nr:RNA polymerase sporulation sigma factor SigH [Clostridiales bacterium]